MKKTSLFFLLLLISLACFAEEFTAISDDNTLKYSVNADSENTVSLSGLPSGTGVGALIIPSSVTNNGTEYTVTRIAAMAFKDCSTFAGSLSIPNTITEIGSYAFASCSGFTGNLNIPSSVVKIDVAAFYQCSGFTGDLIIPNSVKIMGTSVFRGCVGFNGTLTISESLSEIKSSTFRDCISLSGDVRIPNNVTIVSDYAFSNCSSLDGSLYLSDRLSKIVGGAFSGCSKFDSIISNNVTPPNINESYGAVFDYALLNNHGTIVKVPMSAINTYRNAKCWSNFDNYNSVSIVFNPNGAVGEMDIQRITIGETENLYKNEFFNVGNSFVGWAYSPDAEVIDFLDKAEFTATQNDTLYAIWEVGVVKVKFIPNGGDGDMPIQSFTYSKPDTLMRNVFSKTDHKFIGWSKNVLGYGVDYENQDTFLALADITLYAIWQHDSLSSSSSGIIDDIDFDYFSSDGNLNIIIPKSTNNIQVYTALGVLLKNVSSIVGEQVCIPNLNPGVYIVRIQTGKSALTKKIIIR